MVSHSTTNADSNIPLTTFQYHFSNTANTWDDVRGPNNEKLKIGRVSLQYARNGSRNGKNTCNEEETKFVDGVGSPPPREVKAAIHLLLRLLLGSSKSEETEATDSLMCEIAQGRSTKPDKNTNRLDVNFITSFIDMLNLNLTLNDFTNRSAPPSDMDEEIFDKEFTEILTHNHKILVHYLRSIDQPLFGRFSIKSTPGRRTISQIFSTRRDISNKLNNGVCTCWSTYEGETNPKKKPMWIHHAFLLQFIVKNVNDRLHQVSMIHWNKFMKVSNDASTENRRKLFAWNGYNVMDKELNKKVLIEAAAVGVLTSEASFVSAGIDADVVGCVGSDIAAADDVAADAVSVSLSGLTIFPANDPSVASYEWVGGGQVVLERAAEGALTSDALYLSAHMDADVVDIHNFDRSDWNKLFGNLDLDDASKHSSLDEEFNEAVSESAAKRVLTSEVSFGSASMDADNFFNIDDDLDSISPVILDMTLSQITADDDTDFSSFDGVSIEHDDFSKECVVNRDVPVAQEEEMQDIATRNDARTFVCSDSQGFQTISEGSDGIGMFDDADAIEDGATTDKACEKNTLGVVHKSPTQRDIHLKIKRCCKSEEDMMSVPSTGHDGQDGGGVYQTGRSGDIANLINIIEPIFKRLQQDFPTIKKIFLDAGCGQHKPGVQFALEGEYRSIGLEIDTARCALAVRFLQKVLGEYPHLKVAIFNENIAIPGNWSGVAVFYFWDRVSPSPPLPSVSTFSLS